MQEKINNDIFKPNDIVKSCPYLEKGLCFQLDGLTCCCHGSTMSPYIITNEEITQNKVDYDLIIQRKKELFLAINGKTSKDIGGCKNCTNIIEKKYKDVCLDYIGGEYLPGAFNIQHYTECNERCIYCPYAQNNDLRKPQYDILKIWDLFKKKGKLKGYNWIDFSGGEPAMLKNLDEILKYILKHNMGQVVIYTNATIFSPIIYKGLKKNKFILTTSFDTGIATKYAEIKGANLYTKLLQNTIKYRNSGTKGLWLKYVITDNNKNDDDMWSFIMTMLAIRPNKVLISPEFPYGDKEISIETVKFAAKLWYNLEMYLGDIVLDSTTPHGDQKLQKYHKELEIEINKLKCENPLLQSNTLIQIKQTPSKIPVLLGKLGKMVPDIAILNKFKKYIRTKLISWGIF